MTAFKEISLNNGQILKDVTYAGSKDDFVMACKTEFEIDFERQDETMNPEIIHLLSETIVYYVFSNK